jgi:hypothetical protein
LTMRGPTPWSLSGTLWGDRRSPSPQASPGPSRLNSPRRRSRTPLLLKNLVTCRSRPMVKPGSSVPTWRQMCATALHLAMCNSPACCATRDLKASQVRRMTR